MNKINPLLAVMSVRDLTTCHYWIRETNFVDKLMVRFMPHDKAHAKVREFFLKHKEYTHLIINAEDIIATPSHVRLLIKDAMDTDYPIISGFTNWDFIHNSINVTDKDLRGVKIFSATQYRFKRPLDVAIYDEKNPFMKVFFVGLPLTIIRRDIVEKIPFRPYKYVVDRTLGVLTRRGIMFDLQFAIDCANNNIPIYVDKRLFLIHFGDTRRLINLRGKRPEIIFERRRRNTILTSPFF